MFCANCGNEIGKGLRYCSGCGARIHDPAETEDRSRIRNISTAIGFIGFGGIIGFIMLVKTLLDHNVLEGPMIIILLAFLATIFGISFLLINQLKPDAEKTAGTVAFRDDAPLAVGSAADTNKLGEPREEPAGSVVEDTTRTLDEVFVKRR